MCSPLLSIGSIKQNELHSCKERAKWTILNLLSSFLFRKCLSEIFPLIIEKTRDLKIGFGFSHRKKDEFVRKVYYQRRFLAWKCGKSRLRQMSVMVCLLFTMVGFSVCTGKGGTGERVRTAFKNNRLSLPPKRVTVNFAPADMKKEGAGFDLPVARQCLRPRDPETGITEQSSGCRRDQPEWRNPWCFRNPASCDPCKRTGVTILHYSGRKYPGRKTGTGICRCLG